jgi:hypothetical protein
LKILLNFDLILILFETGIFFLTQFYNSFKLHATAIEYINIAEKQKFIKTSQQPFKKFKKIALEKLITTLQIESHLLEIVKLTKKLVK